MVFKMIMMIKMILKRIGDRCVHERLTKMLKNDDYDKKSNW
jgi:hypothetical protein